MFHYFLAYRHGNGEVEGFAATRFTRERAQAACEAAIREKVSHTPHAFDPARVIRSKDGITDAEFETIKADWKIVTDGKLTTWPVYRE